MCRWLREEVPKYDVVIASDFGHGTVSAGMVRELVCNARFLAVNTQANAGNRGFHTVTRYPRADYVCLAEHEMRLEMRDLTGRIPAMMDVIAAKLENPTIVVTRGRRGCVVRDREGGFVEIPSFAGNVVDRIGAGDAFFSITAPAAERGVPAEILGLLGNVAGSLAVEVLGNQNSIDKLSMKKCLMSLLK